MARSDRQTERERGRQYLHQAGPVLTDREQALAKKVQGIGGEERAHYVPQASVLVLAKSRLAVAVSEGRVPASCWAPLH